MTLILSKNKIIFVHVPKTGGESITDSLLQYAGLRQKLWYSNSFSTKLLRKTIYEIEKILPERLNPDFASRRWVTGYKKHEKSIDIQKKLGHSYCMYYSFAVIRNPYTHWISFYNYIKKCPSHPYNQYANQSQNSLLDIIQLKKPHGLQTPFVTDARGNSNVSKLFRFEDVFSKSILSLPGWNSPIKIRHLNSNSTKPIGQHSPGEYSISDSIKAYLDNDYQLWSNL